MEDPLSLKFIGAQLRSVQAGQRTIHTKLDALTERVAGIEARIDTRFDEMQSDIIRSLDKFIEVLQSPTP
jgi:hypothetical protein